MKTVVTGDKGFIGKNLMKCIEAQGYDKKDGLDLNDKRMLDIVFRRTQPEVVIHLAALADVNAEMEDCVKDNINGTVNLLEACKKHNVKQIIFMSSAAVYGEMDVDKLQDEEYPLNPLSLYGISKQTGEQLIDHFCRHNKINYTIFRLGNLYGEGGRGIINKIMSDLYAPITINGGDQERDFIHVSDVIAAIKVCMNGTFNENGIYNICTGKPITINKLIGTIKRVTKQSLMVSTGGLASHEIIKTAMSPEKAREDFCFIPKVSLSDGIRKLFNKPKKLK